MVDELNIIVNFGMKTKWLKAKEMLLAGEVIFLA